MKKSFTISAAGIAVLGIGLLSAGPAFAHGNPPSSNGRNSGQKNNNNNGRQDNDNGGQNNNGGAKLPGPQGDYFLLTHFSANPVKGQANTYTLNVTVEQYQFDGDDGTNNETHYFPNTVPVSWNGGTTTATLIGSKVGINYTNKTTGNVSATASYTLTFQHALTSTTQLSVGPFYMQGPTIQSGRSKDDKVYDSPVSIPYGQLPEVPWAAGIPVVGLAAAALILRRKLA